MLINFIKVSVSKVVTTFILIVAFISGRRLAVLSDYPGNSLIIQLDRIIFSPAELVSGLVKGNFFIGTVYLTITLAEYYLMGCLLVWFMRLILLNEQTKKKVLFSIIILALLGGFFAYLQWVHL